MQLPFEQLQGADDMRFLQHQLTVIVGKVFSLVNVGFGAVEVKADFSPWSRRFTPSFYRYVISVSRSDPHAGGWDRLLCDRFQRNMLISAVIIKVLDSEVLSSLLFGASHDHSKVLVDQDKQLALHEGFQRTSIRAATNLEFLNSSDGVPPRFWEEVDRLAAQTLSMLLPLYNMLGEVGPEELMPLQWIYQKLHDVIALGGAFNYVTRTYPIVLESAWAVPGDALEIDQRDVAPELHAESAMKASQHDSLANTNPNHPRRARVQICITPRMLAYVEDQGGRLVSYKLMRPRALFYQGYVDEMENKWEFVALGHHLRNVKRARRPSVAMILLFGIVLWALSALVWSDKATEVLGVSSKMQEPDPDARPRMLVEELKKMEVFSKWYSTNVLDRYMLPHTQTLAGTAMSTAFLPDRTNSG
ncbi:hypothetical protein B0I35DRAFT_480150 [Stachybotrys elegans]|uniref:Uncharacterized protein n=1 Tax=Stachybotrys elegans TaxID=80388 RepID=A0A8K0ST33_9HYPO|nr:hypothetical protein B0I35DRAFT_480150 [Stachybotrys elegans]